MKGTNYWHSDKSKSMLSKLWRKEKSTFHIIPFLWTSRTRKTNLWCWPRFTNRRRWNRWSMLTFNLLTLIFSLSIRCLKGKYTLAERRQDTGWQEGAESWPASWNIFASQLGPLCTDVFLGTRGRGKCSNVPHISEAMEYLFPWFTTFLWLEVRVGDQRF